MPGENIQDWSTSATANGTADSSINWAEGQPRASVNNSARSMMAAHAKNRNLQNGSIITAGTVNAQTFFSGLTYTAVPTGLRALLKVGPSLTNTSTMTIDMDGIGAVAVKSELGRDLVGGEFVAGGYVEVLYDGTNWIVIAGGASAVVPQSGRLYFISATALKFAPFNGDKIKISGLLFDIPTAGISGLANTGIFLNGVAAGNLAANSLYYVYAFNNAGVITADFSITGHTSSTTSGNVGTEIKTGDDSRSLIGMVRTNASAQFQDNATYRGVLGWFNRRALALQNTNAIPVFSTSMVNLGADVNFLAWSDAAVQASAEGYATAGSAPGLAYTQTQLALNGFFCGMAINDSNAFGLYANWSTSHVGTVSEGVNFFQMYGGSPNGEVQQMTFIINAITFG